MINPTEQLLICMYKDAPMGTKQQFRDKLSKYENIDFENVYVSVYNYQIKKYGEVLISGTKFNTFEKKPLRRLREYNKRRSLERYDLKKFEKRNED